jgi:ribosomal protein S6--L-glutamate ligase
MIKKAIKYTIIGWREWCSLPDLGLPAVKAKVDTGAATSALHAFNVREFTKHGKRYVRFCVHPLQKNKKIMRECVAELVDKRQVKSSSGHKDERYVITTPIIIGGETLQAEITLTKRDLMTFRMLIGRQALKKSKMVVNPRRSFFFGRATEAETNKLYEA